MKNRNWMNGTWNTFDVIWMCVANSKWCFNVQCIGVVLYNSICSHGDRFCGWWCCVQTVENSMWCTMWCCVCALFSALSPLIAIIQYSCGMHSRLIIEWRQESEKMNEWDWKRCGNDKETKWNENGASYVCWHADREWNFYRNRIISNELLMFAQRDSRGTYRARFSHIEAHRRASFKCWKNFEQNRSDSTHSITQDDTVCMHIVAKCNFLFIAFMPCT